MKTIKTITVALFASILLIGCSDNKISFEYKTIKTDNKTAEVDITYPYFSSKNSASADKMNDAISKLLIYDESDSTLSISEQIEKISQDILSDTTNRDMKYSFIASSKVTYYGNIISIRIDRVDFTGGAHYNYYTSIVNFNSKGEAISNEEMLVNRDEFLENVRTKYCETREIDTNSSAEDAIMFVSPKEMPIAENIGIDSTGIVVYYNRYEVTPFYIGSTEVKIPFEDGAKYINPKYK